MYLAKMIPMVPPNLRSNDPLTPEQTAMLRESISSRQSTMESLIRSIKKDELEVSAQTAAIKRLEETIPITEQARRTQKTTLSSLVQMKANLDSASAARYGWMSSEMNKPCEAIITDLDDQLKSSATKLDESISRLTEYLHSLSLSIRELETELSNRRYMRDTLSQYISDTRNHKGKIEKNIEILRSMLNNVRHVPAEVWAEIFSLRVHADMGEFFAQPQTNSMSVTTIKLSHVSRLWRSVVLSQRSLWQFIPVDHRDRWSLPSLELLRCFLSRSGQEATFVCNLSERQRHNFFSSVRADETPMLDRYSVHIVFSGYNYGSPSSIPFRQPKTLKLQFPSEPQRLATLLDTFSEISSLEIITKGHSEPVESALSAVQQQLVYLKLDMTTFMPFDVTRYLGSSLEELHIRHNGISSIPPSTAFIRLPQLRVLGVTPPDTNFTHLLDLPALKKIILYGPRESEIAIDSLAQFADNPNFKRVRELELREWPLFKPKMADEWDIMTPMGDVVDKMRSIESLRCVDSVINGSGFVKLVSALKDATNTTGSKFKHVVIDCCTGITRGQCDAVTALVDKMEVYV